MSHVTLFKFIRRNRVMVDFFVVPFDITWRVCRNIIIGYFSVEAVPLTRENCIMLQIYLPRQYTIYFTNLPRHQKILNLISTANVYLFGNTDRKISNTEFHIAFYFSIISVKNAKSRYCCKQNIYGS